jgi:hypothetical protein
MQASSTPTRDLQTASCGMHGSSDNATPLCSRQAVPKHYTTRKQMMSESLPTSLHLFLFFPLLRMHVSNTFKTKKRPSRAPTKVENVVGPKCCQSRGKDVDPNLSSATTRQCLIEVQTVNNHNNNNRNTNINKPNNNTNKPNNNTKNTHTHTHTHSHKRTWADKINGDLV